MLVGVVGKVPAVGQQTAGVWPVLVVFLLLPARFAVDTFESVAAAAEGKQPGLHEPKGTPTSPNEPQQTQTNPNEPNAAAAQKLVPMLLEDTVQAYNW